MPSATSPTQSLIVTGASGHLGRQVAKILLDRDDIGRLLLVTRHPEVLADLTAQGAEVRYGDFDDPTSLDAAFAGGTRMLLVSTDAIGRRIAQHTNAIQAAKAAGIGHVIYTSIPNATPNNPALAVADHIGTEDALAASGLAWTFLRNALYAEYRASEAQQAAESGFFHHNQGNGHSAYVSRADCAAAAAAVLVAGTEHHNRAYDITGPDLLSGQDLARLYSDATGRKIEAVSMDDDAITASLRDAGMPAEVAVLLASFGTAIRKGYLDQLSTDITTIVGRAPESVTSVLNRLFEVNRARR